MKPVDVRPRTTSCFNSRLGGKCTFLATASAFVSHQMFRIASRSSGRVLLHLVCMIGDRSVRFHVDGIMREFSLIAAAHSFASTARHCITAALLRFLARPVDRSRPQASADAELLSALLRSGDVLVSRGNTRFAALVNLLTRSPWSHVSIYVGPLDGGQDPPCIIEADVAAGVRSIRLSELNALQVRVLRPVGMNNTEHERLADLLVSRIGSEYDRTHAWSLARALLKLSPLARPTPMSSVVGHNATRFICCSLLAHSFAAVGHPIMPSRMQLGLSETPDLSQLIPADFERASLFEVAGLPDRGP